MSTTHADHVRALVHVAYFENSSAPKYFLKVVNDSMEKQVVIDEIWFETEPRRRLSNPERPLPTAVDPCDTFETWLGVYELPPDPKIAWKARIELSDGSVVSSEPNRDVAPAGVVGGGGTPLSEVYVGPRGAGKEWDVFISHASEDKEDVGRPLYEALTRFGVRVWFDEATLQLGDSLRRRIDEGVAHSRFGVIILSPSFISKQWTQYELDGIVAMTVSGKQRLLPIWHRITQDEVLQMSPSLADKVARNTSGYSVAQIAEEIARRVRPDLFAT